MFFSDENSFKFDFGFIKIFLKGGSPGLVVMGMTYVRKVVGSNPSSEYCMDDILSH